MKRSRLPDFGCAAGMQAPGTPTDEAERLSALYRLKLLDTAPTDSFDRVTRMAAKALGMPIVLVSLVDSDRQWFKSAVGLEAKQTSREISFCGHVVFERRPLIVNDATADPRFAGNPLVTGAPYVRAYMGMPLFTLDQQPIGTLCAIDTLMRIFTADELSTLREFAHILEDSIHATELVAQSDSVLRYACGRERLFRDTFEYAAIGIVHISANGRMHRVNQQASTLLGYTKVELLGIPFPALFDAEAAGEHERLFEQLAAQEIRDYGLDTCLRSRDGARVPVHLSVARGNVSEDQLDYYIMTLGSHG